MPSHEVASLHDSDWAAYQYASRHRSTLGIPEGLSFTVPPRVDSTKVIGPEDETGWRPSSGS